MNKYLLKVDLFGDPRVGKLALIERLVQNRFYLVELINYSATLRDERPKSRSTCPFYIKDYSIEEKIIKLQLWSNHYEEDLQRFRRRNLKFFSQGLVLSYDLTRNKTLYNLENWLEVLQEKVDLFEIPKILVGCKLDLEEKCQVSKEEALEFAITHHFQKDEVFETSAKTGMNVELIFTTIMKKIINKLESNN